MYIIYKYIITSSSFPTFLSLLLAPVEGTYKRGDQLIDAVHASTSCIEGIMSADLLFCTFPPLVLREGKGR